MYRFASVRHVVSAVAVTVVCSAVPAAAQETTPRLTAAIQLESVPLPSLFAPVFVEAPMPAPPLARRRPSALMPMYVSFASLQALDAHSTSRALDRGAVEANPLMRGLAGNTAGMLAVKAGATTAVVYSAERIWRKNRTAAVLFMVAANSAMAWVVQHNYRVVR